MRKCSFILVVLLVLSLCIPAYAAETVESRAYIANPTLSFDGTTAICFVNCRGEKTTDRISATLTLYHNGTYVDSWSGSGVFRVPVSGECEVESGETYELVLTWTVNGTSKPSESVTGTCP